MFADLRPRYNLCLEEMRCSRRTDGVSGRICFEGPAFYRRYVQDTTPDLYNDVLRTKVRAYVDERNHRQHAYVVGTTRSGKTELLKSLVYEFMQLDNASVVFLDPVGDVSKQIARWPEFERSNRLVYFDLRLRKGYAPVINPFDAEGLDDEDKIALADQILSAFQEILGEGRGSDLSVNMEGSLCRSLSATELQSGPRYIVLFRCKVHDMRRGEIYDIKGQ